MFIALAHSLKLAVVAEGVEMQEQSHLLHLLACDEAQRYRLSKPTPYETIEELLREFLLTLTQNGFQLWIALQAAACCRCRRRSRT